MNIIYIEQDEIVEQPKKNIVISVEGDNTSVKIDDAEYKVVLKALEALAFATTKLGLKQYKTHIGVIGVMQDVCKVIVNGRDNALGV